jgi:hypothetical protein
LVNPASRHTHRAYPSAKGELIDHAEIKFASPDETGKLVTGGKGYLRVTIEDAEGHQAWSKAMPLAELLDSPVAAP